jgi:hypothetical protein
VRGQIVRHEPRDEPGRLVGRRPDDHFHRVE